MDFMHLLKFISVLTGAYGFYKGINMVELELSTKGTIDFVFPFASGKLETGSAGLLVMFVGVFLILGTLWKREKKIVREETKKRTGNKNQLQEEEHKKEIQDEKID